jgi:hypothetical protein
MRRIVSLFIFCIVLFVYLHVVYQLKTSNDLEIYELDDVSKEQLEEICDIRQPVVLSFYSSEVMNSIQKSFMVTNYPTFDVQLRDNSREKEVDKEELYIPLPIHKTSELFQNDKEKKYFSEKNTDFLEETGIVKIMKYNDEYLRPCMLMNSKYDMIFSSDGCETPFRYEVNYRNFFMVTEGRVRIKLAPPSSTKYLHRKYDYENFEFRSPIHPWNVQPEFSLDFQKIKCLEVVVPKGKTIYIPAYWWYSMKMEKDTMIAGFRYRTYMNNVAITPYIFMYILQMQNIKRKSIPILDKQNDEPVIEEQKESILETNPGEKDLNKTQ